MKWNSGCVVGVLAAFLLSAACKKNGHDGHDHGPGGTHEGPKAASAPAAGHHSGAVVELGSAPIGEFAVRATRDVGELKPGGEAPIDVYVDGDRKKVAAVRFWIGIESGEGSLKVLAPVEGDHWHTHAEIPNPLPPNSKLWVEIESSSGTISRAPFPL